VHDAVVSLAAVAIPTHGISRSAAPELPTRHRPVLRQPTTIVAIVVLVAAAVAALSLRSSAGGAGAAAASVGGVTITEAAVEREVSAIQAQPAYAAALRNASTLALAAPVDPRAVMLARGDPDDLRVTLAPANGVTATRPYSTADLRASVLTRALYVSVLQQVLRSRRVMPTIDERTEGRQQARYESGQDSAGGSLFDRLPSWYQVQLAERGANIEALERSLVGAGAISDAQLASAYQRRVPTDFTTVCLRVAVVNVDSVAAGRAALAGGGPGSRDAGCAPMGAWTSDVAVDVRSTPVGQVAAPVQRGGRVALLLVTRRTELPLSAVAGNVRAQLSARYADIVNLVVENELAVLPVSVSAHYGTYENLGSTHSVLPPDALTPPSAATGQPVAPPVTSPPQRLDPFD